MKRVLALGLIFLTCSANPNQAPIDASKKFTETYAKLPLELHGDPAGIDCHVLLIQSADALDDNAVERLHYGIPDFDRYGGGVRQFATDHQFRAVVYVDPAHHLWTYGTITHEEATKLPSCH